MPLKQGWNARISGQETQLEPRPRPCPGQLGSVAAALTGSRASEAEVGELNPGARTLLLPPHSGVRITAPDTSRETAQVPSSPGVGGAQHEGVGRRVTKEENVNVQHREADQTRAPFHGARQCNFNNEI